MGRRINRDEVGGRQRWDGSTARDKVSVEKLVGDTFSSRDLGSMLFCRLDKEMGEDTSRRFCMCLVFRF